MQINNVPPPPIDNDPPPPMDEGKKKLQQFISKAVWGSFKTWLAVQLTAAVNQILQLLQNVTFDGNKGVGSINGLPATPGMAQMRDGGKYEFLAGQRVGLLPYNLVVQVISGTWTVSSATGVYYQVGKLVFIYISIQVNTFTTAGVAGFNTPPGLPVATNQIILTGRENATAGYTLTTIAASPTLLEIFHYTGSNSVTAAGNLLQVSGVYYTGP